MQPISDDSDAPLRERDADPTSDAGLTEEEAAARRRAGLGNTAPPGTSRSVFDIVRANVMTRFNALLGGLFVLVLVVGPPQDALFGLVMVANSGIAIIQEVRAKRTLDSFKVLTTPTVSVVRSDRSRTISVHELVEGDLVEIGADEQVSVDGAVLASSGL